MPNHKRRNGGEIATQRPNIGAIGNGDAHYALLLHSPDEVLRGTTKGRCSIEGGRWWVVGARWTMRDQAG